MNHALAFYRQHSPITAPGKYAYLYDALPDDVNSIARTIQGLLIPPHGQRRYGVKNCATANDGFGLRPVEQVLERLMQIHDAPLTQARPPEQRFAINCRNFGTLFASMLRHKNLPARLRVGFAGYFRDKLWYDHRITEYWNGTRWTLADAMMDDVHRQAYGLTWDTLNFPGDAPFALAGQAWVDCRAGKVDPMRYADSPTDRGMPMIRYALLHDFDALNRHEIMGCDSWHELQTRHEAGMTESEYALLDEIAAATLNAASDTGLENLQKLYAESDYGQAVTANLRAEGLAAS